MTVTRSSKACGVRALIVSRYELAGLLASAWKSVHQQAGAVKDRKV
ncbi:hypothetical protein KCP73_09890 [Salmonella enterica subsp. enterica]|nr:hypothetical protein KCP73_09890 [Salmonella enterica subsp. enterica]